ncbi:hypothetical protein LWI29_034634 [Acer saccharum]|uniref:CCHC-type domain-containing protein n=1 Tax=Acer saccharum TaxID=4024 RepID=A0AA39VJN1_ACESA|nr:hypothetical protein LWI29_034634 [Acer saccharum]
MQFDLLAVVEPELHMHGGYDPENEAGHRETRSKGEGGYDNDLRSYIESWFEQIDLKIDKLLADRVHVPVPPIPVAPVPHVPVAPIPPVPPIPVAPQPTSQPTWSAKYTRSYVITAFDVAGWDCFRCGRLGHVIGDCLEKVDKGSGEDLLFGSCLRASSMIRGDPSQNRKEVHRGGREKSGSETLVKDRVGNRGTSRMSDQSRRDKGKVTIQSLLCHRKTLISGKIWGCISTG